MEIVALAVAVIALVALFRWMQGPWLVLEMADGQVSLVRGEAPPRLLADLPDTRSKVRATSSSVIGVVPVISS